MAVRSLECHWNSLVESSWLLSWTTRPILRLSLQASWAGTTTAKSGKLVNIVVGGHFAKLKIASSKKVDATTGARKV